MVDGEDEEYLKGYYVDMNGKKFVYKIEKNDLSEISIDGLYRYIKYYMKKQEDSLFNEVKWIKQSDFEKSCECAIGLLNETENPQLSCDGNAYLYFFSYEWKKQEIVSYSYYLVGMKEGDKVLCDNEAGGTIIEIFGEDWADFE